MSEGERMAKGRGKGGGGRGVGSGLRLGKATLAATENKALEKCFSCQIWVSVAFHSLLIGETEEVKGPEVWDLGVRASV